MFTCIKSTQTAVEADILIVMLRSAGFHPLDLATGGHFSMWGNDISFQVLLPTEEVAEAQQFLIDLNA
ncbi:MAG: hypothetical protein EXS25_05485 [Pedosphaera sp.]|nr:hypothetical protein [Pedosphaera sp.]